MNKSECINLFHSGNTVCILHAYDNTIITGQQLLIWAGFYFSDTWQEQNRRFKKAHLLRSRVNDIF